MEIKLIPKIETQIKELKYLLGGGASFTLFAGVVTLITKWSLRTALFLMGFTVLLFLPFICLWAIYTVIGAKISKSKRLAIVELGARVEGVVRKEVWRRGRGGRKESVRWVIEYQNPQPKTWKSPLYPVELAFLLEPECKCLLYVRGRSVCLAEDQSEELVREQLLRTAQNFVSQPSQPFYGDFEQMKEMLGIEGKRQIQEGSVSEIKYSIETFPRLSEAEADEMDEEWKLTYNVITDSFFRFFPNVFFIPNQDVFSEVLFDVYVEIRYRNGKPDEDILLLTEEKMDEKLKSLSEEYGAKGMGQIDCRIGIQAELQRKIRDLLAQHMPDLEITDVLVAPMDFSELE